MTDITENGKYYIPSIEELGINKEFEVFLSKDKGWEKIIPSTFGTLESAIRFPFRVKFLDHDDIVECGWEAAKIGSAFNKGYYTLYYQKPGIGFTYNISISKRNFAYNETKLESIILNKSELKFIMKRLGI